MQVCWAKKATVHKLDTSMAADQPGDRRCPCDGATRLTKEGFLGRNLAVLGCPPSWMSMAWCMTINNNTQKMTWIVLAIETHEPSIKNPGFITTIPSAANINRIILGESINSVNTLSNILKLMLNSRRWGADLFANRSTQYWARVMPLCWALRSIE